MNRLQRACMSLALCVLLAAGLGLLSGCAAAPQEWHPLPCEPLPTCSIPEKATSNQLDEALWACVLEYRALYSHCAHRRAGK